MATTIRATMLWYNIPSTLRLQSPASALHASGCIWMDGSVWLVTDNMVATVQARVVKPMLDKGARAGWVRFDEKDAEAIITLARERLSQRIFDIRDALDGSAAFVLNKLNGIATNDEKKQKQVQAHAAGVVKKARRQLSEAKESALLFDLTGEFTNLFDATLALIKAKDVALWEQVSGRLKKTSVTPIPTNPSPELIAAAVAEYEAEAAMVPDEVDGVPLAPTTTDGESHLTDEPFADDGEFEGEGEDEEMGNNGEPPAPSINEDADPARDAGLDALDEQPGFDCSEPQPSEVLDDLALLESREEQEGIPEDEREQYERETGRNLYEPSIVATCSGIEVPETLTENDKPAPPTTWAWGSK